MTKQAAVRELEGQGWEYTQTDPRGNARLTHPTRLAAVWVCRGGEFSLMYYTDAAQHPTHQRVRAFARTVQGLARMLERVASEAASF